MNNNKHPWFGLEYGMDDIFASNDNNPKPLYNEKSQRDQDKALQNPEQSIDKDPDRPWVQGEDKSAKDADVPEDTLSLPENGDPPIDEPVDPRTRKKSGYSD